jgi:calcium-dependent protein kinase
MLMYQLLTGTFPFWDNIRTRTLQEVWKSILVDKLDLDTPELRSQMSRPALDLLHSLLQRDPNHRLSALQALQHPWIKELDDHPEIPLAGSVLQRIQRFATYGRMKQMVLLKVSQEIIDRGSTSLSTRLLPPLQPSPSHPIPSRRRVFHITHACAACYFGQYVEHRLLVWMCS